jgi:hypothetical protein
LQNRLFKTQYNELKAMRQGGSLGGKQDANFAEWEFTDFMTRSRLGCEVLNKIKLFQQELFLPQVLRLRFL